MRANEARAPRGPDAHARVDVGAPEDAIDEEAVLEGRATLAELQGMTAELGAAILRLAELELQAGRLEPARTILEGLVVSNPHHGDAWTLLSQTHRRLGQPLAARFCAGVAVHLLPTDPWARLARVEGWLALGVPEAARDELVSLAVDPDVGTRARGLLGALGDSPAIGPGGSPDRGPVPEQESP